MSALDNNWIKLYDLSEDGETIALIQNASQNKADFGYVSEVALFGTDEWWSAIEDGHIRRHVIEGVISHLYMSGSGDWPEFEILSGGATSRWTRYGEQHLYAVGKKVRLDYVFQKPKNGCRTQDIKQILQIFICQ